jgi:hypothetical protein
MMPPVEAGKGEEGGCFIFVPAWKVKHDQFEKRT